MKETYYFSHDYSARSDAKIKRLIAQHGMHGYGIYWAIIEDLYNNANALPSDYDCIAFDLRVDKNVIDSIINDFGLFENNGNYFTSLSVKRRLDERKEKSEKARESAKYRWQKITNNANAKRTQCDSNAIKERKGKEKKEDIIFNKAVKFYNTELENCNGSDLKKDYKLTVDYLINNPILNRPVYHILKIEKQLTFSQFQTLCNLYTFDMFKDKLKVWVNNTEYSKGKTTIYNTLDAWCKNKYRK